MGCNEALHELHYVRSIRRPLDGEEERDKCRVWSRVNVRVVVKVREQVDCYLVVLLYVCLDLLIRRAEQYERRDGVGRGLARHSSLDAAAAAAASCRTISRERHDQSTTDCR